jgi:hypothetical protein
MTYSKRIWLLTTVTGWLLILFVIGASGAIPAKINYQGRLTDTVTGQAMSGEHDMVFRIFEVATGGTEVWSETVSVEVDSTGVFSVLLGAINPIDLEFEQPVWLEIEVEGEVLTPRREVASVPFAFFANRTGHAADSDSLAGLDAESYSLTGHTHTNEGIAPGAEIDPAKIAGTAWTAANDGDGSGLDADMVDGLHADAFADTSHDHNDLYFTKEEMQDTGTINNPDNPVDWTELKSVPGGLADGIDDVGGAGDGHSLDAADGDPVDVVFVNDAGRVGIGSATFTFAELEVVTNTDNAIFGSSNYTNGVYGYSAAGTGVRGETTTGKAGTFVGDVYVNGALGVGTDTPGATLGVAGNIDADSLYLINGERAMCSFPKSKAVAVGIDAGPAYLSYQGTFVGHGAGHNSFQTSNTFVGAEAGYETSLGYANTFVGARAGKSNTDDEWNTLIGAGTGETLSSGYSNTMLGAFAGTDQTSGYHNTYIGAFAGGDHSSGSSNTYVGSSAGRENDSGSGNVFIGSSAGYHVLGSDKFILANGPDTSDVLLYGDFSDGRVGLGTMAPERQLHIKGVNPRILIEATSSNPEVDLKHTGDASADVWAVYKDSATEDLRFYQDGDRIWVQGGTGNLGLGHEPGAYRLYVQGAAYATGAWNTSDLRFKKDIEDIGGAIDKVMNLRGVSFLWRRDEYAEKNFDPGRHYGVIAQETQKVLPEVVREGPDGEQAVAYTQIVPVLIEAIKAQQARIEDLEERIAELESRPR